MTTPLQAAMLTKIARSEFTSVNGAEPETSDEAATFTDCVIESAEDKGVFTSLLNSGLIWSTTDGNKRDHECGLTDSGFAAYKELKA